MKALSIVVSTSLFAYTCNFARIFFQFSKQFSFRQCSQWNSQVKRSSEFKCDFPWRYLRVFKQVRNLCNLASIFGTWQKIWRHNFLKNYTQRFSWLTQKLRKDLLSKKAEEIRLKKTKQCWGTQRAAWYQSRTSLCNILYYLVIREVERINDKITQDEFSTPLLL